MVATVPKGVYTMKDRYVIIKHNAKAYQKAKKKQKSEMLDELSAMLRRLVDLFLRKDVEPSKKFGRPWK